MPFAAAVYLFIDPAYLDTRAGTDGPWPAF